MTLIYGAGGGSPKQSAPKTKQPPKPIITQDDPALKSISFAKLQFLLCEGEIEGPAYGNNREGLEKSVFLDDTPVRSAANIVSPQPEDLVFSYGRDHSLQSGVPDYNRVTNTIGVDKLCDKDKPVTQTIPATIAGGIYYARVLLTWQQLFVQVVDGDGAPVSGPSGSVKTYRVDYVVTYSDNNGTVRSAFNGYVEGKFSSTFQRSHEFRLDGPGPWEVSVTRKTDNDENAFGGDKRVGASSKFNFSSIAQSLDQKFSFANSAVLSVGVKADQYSQIPNVSIELKGLKVQVPSNFDPNARTYAGSWDGTFKVAWTDDPAWCLRDLIINDRYGAGQYIDETFVDKWSLYEISKYCNERVPAPGGGHEPRFTCNLLLQSSGEAWQVLQQISSIFRGMVYYASSIAVAAQDKEKDAIFTFNESNTIEQVDDDGLVSEGNFTYSGSARRARHTVCLASWDDPANNYETRIEYVTDDETFSDYGYRPIDLRLLGVTSRGQALRAANWTLLSERLLSDTVAFKTNEIGMALRPGDIVKIADPTKAAVRGGGRIMGVVGNRITLDYVPPRAPGGVVGSKLSWMYNEPVTATDGPNQPRLETANVLSVGSDVVLSDWQNGEGICIDPPDPATDFDVSDADTFISGNFISICTDPMDAIFDPGTTNFDNADVQPRSEIRQGAGDVVVIDNDGGHRPEVGNPFLLEFPGRSAQQFRVLTVTQEEEGVYAITGLRYRDDIYDAVDFDTPLQEDQNYLFKAVVPEKPTNVLAQVVWDNGQAKIDVRWQPPANSAILFEYDLTVREYRVQWQSGTVVGGTPQWSGSWRELPPQTDDRELIPIEELDIADKFRVRIAAVGRLGIQSDWSDYVVADDITTWFPLPDISTGSILNFQNQSSGGQLFIWNFQGVNLPPYVNGVRLDVKPNRALTEREKRGLKQPDADGRYIYGDYPLEEYAVGIFHADTNWTCRVSLLTAVIGLQGNTFASVTVTRNDLVPPPPDRFTVVTETDNKSLAPLRRFSWSLPTSEIDDTRSAPVPFSVAGESKLAAVSPNWPLGKVTDITQFRIRYKAGLSNVWDYGVPLFADGVPGDQRFFETELFDGGQWTVMIRSVDRTGWVSDDQAAIQINLGDAIPTNVVDEFEAHTDGWPGQKVNCSVVGGKLVQTDPTIDAFYSYAFEVKTTTEDSGPLITTKSDGTYQWFIKGVSAGDELMYPDPQGDPMYPAPQTDYMYLETDNTIGEDFHPYVPFEKLTAGNYEIACTIKSIDGVTATELEEVTLQLDYPDVRQSMEDVTINNTGNQTVAFPTPFPHKCKAVSVTLQDPPGAVTVPATAYIRGKTVDNFTIRLLDADGNIISGLADIVAVGY